MAHPPLEFRLGKNAVVHDDRTLSLAAYLTAELPTPPDSVDNYTRVPKWPMYNNDKWGDCTCAAAGHMVQAWTAEAGHEVTPQLHSVTKMYEHFVGSPPPEDAGCNMLKVLTYWRRVGLGSDKISAFAAFDLRNHNQLKTAISLFGAAYIGVSLPDDVCVPGKLLSTPWVVPPSGPVGSAAPDPHNGHCIPAVGYDSESVYVVTWGEVKTMSWEFYDAYVDEVYAVLSKDELAPGAGINLTELRADLRKVTNVA
jgi:hypothetical protein